MIQSRIIRLTIASIGSSTIIAKIYLQRRMLKSYEIKIMRLHERKERERKVGKYACIALVARRLCFRRLKEKKC